MIDHFNINLIRKPCFVIQKSMSGKKLDVSKVPKDASSVPEEQVRELADHNSQMGGMAGMSGTKHKMRPNQMLDVYESYLWELERISRLQKLLKRYSNARAHPNGL